MVRVRGSVTMTGGERREFVAGPWEFSQWEQYAQRHALTFDSAPLTFAMYVAFATLHRAEWPPVEGFEAWSRRVDDVDLDSEEESEVRPTEAAPSGDSSPR